MLPARDFPSATYVNLQVQLTSELKIFCFAFLCTDFARLPSSQPYMAFPLLCFFFLLREGRCRYKSYDTE